MATVGSMIVNLGLNRRPLESGLNQSRKSIWGFVGGAVGKFGGLAAGFLGVGAAMKTIGTGLRLAADAEQAEVAFSTLLGSADRAKTVLADVQRFAASTPFQLPQLRDSAQMLAAFGFEAESIVPNLRMLGDIAAGTGQPIDQLAELYGKARVQGRLFGDDINQLTGRGIPVIQALAQQFGVAESEVKNLVAEGKVGFPELQTALQSMTAEGGKFGGMMEAQSKTLSGVWSTFKDNLLGILTEVTIGITNSMDLTGMISSATTGLQTMVTAAKWGFGNWQILAELAFKSAMLGFSRFGAELYHFFTSTLPTLTVWFVENFPEIWSTALDFALTVLINFGQNVRNIMSEIWSFIKSGGMTELNLAWTPLTEGFVSSLRELPKIPGRELTDLERTLTSEVERLGNLTGEGLAEALNKSRQTGELATGPVAPGAPTDVTGPQGQAGDLKGPAALRVGSAEGLGAVLRAQLQSIGGGTDQKKIAANSAKQLAEAKKQTAALERIAEKDLAIEEVNL